MARTGSMGDKSAEEQVEETPVGTPQDEVEEEYDSTKMDPDEELWEGGPNFAQINAWKEEYGDIYVTSVGPDEHVVWRTLTRFEYRRLVKAMEESISTGQVSQAEANMNNEEAIAETCIVYPPYKRTDQASAMAGMASTIAQQVMEASAFVALDVRQL